MTKRKKIGDAPDGAAHAARLYARTVPLDEERALEEEHYLFGNDGGTTVPVQMLIRRIGSTDAEDPFLILDTWGINPGEASAFYRRRWSIEPMFTTLKSRGFDLAETNGTEPDRIESLLGPLALSFGVPPGWQTARAPRGTLPRKIHGRRQWSGFRYGLDALTSALSTPEPQDRPFFWSLSGPRSPTAWAGCT